MCEGGDCWSYPTSVVEEAGEGIHKKLAFDEEICPRQPNKNSMQATLDPCNKKSIFDLYITNRHA
jgi:hypothetical protein